MAIKFKADYLSTNRGIIKIVQIVIGIVLSMMVCRYWYTFKQNSMIQKILGIVDALFVFMIIELDIWRP